MSKWDKFKFNRQQIIIVVILMIIVFMAAGKYSDYMRNTAAHNDGLILSQVEATSPESNGQILVHVKGAVENPGVFTLPVGSRVVDAIDLAVATDEADLQSINLAKIVNDQDEVMVPRKVTAAPIEGGQAEGAGNIGNIGYDSRASEGKVSINSASSQQLQTLSGIGPSKADAIISYRQNNGHFSSIEDIKKVSGIGNSTFEKIKGSITVE
jgi:competence protein ComEA